MKINYVLIIAMMISVSFDVHSADKEILQCEYDPKYVNKSNDSLKWKRTASLYVSPFEVLQKSKQSQYMLLADIRPVSEYKKFSIKNSLNFPNGSLVTKSMFKKHEIILIGNGRDYKKLEMYAEKLQRSGFVNIQILDGGTHFWKKTISGNSLSQKDYQLFDLNSVIYDDISNWTVIDTRDKTIDDDLFPNVIKNANKDTIKQIGQSVKRTKLLKNIMIISNELFSDDLFINNLQKSVRANIFSIQKDSFNVAVNQFNKKQKYISHKKRTDGARFSCQGS